MIEELCLQAIHFKTTLCPAWSPSPCPCREQLSQLSVHVEIASKINRIIEEKNLTELGKLEQDLVFGDATSKEVITYLSANQNLLPEDKVGMQNKDLTHSPHVWGAACAPADVPLRDPLQAHGAFTNTAMNLAGPRLPVELPQRERAGFWLRL